MVNYIENNLDNKIDYQELARIMGVNENTMQRVFCIVCDISLSDYIRKRRLTKAGSDLYLENSTILDVAIKYQYDNGTSFSRAFEKFHGIKPSKVKENPNNLKIQSILQFDEKQNENYDIEYSIIDKEQLMLYGIGVKTNETKIKYDAPKHFEKIMNEYYNKYGVPDYGMTCYEDRNNVQNLEYWVLYNKEINDFKRIVIPSSKWLVFKVNSQEAIDIQETTYKFYEKIINSIDYRVSKLPDLEYYHDDITEILIPIE
jgi:AraC family transcriptional regulator